MRYKWKEQLCDLLSHFCTPLTSFDILKRPLGQQNGLIYEALRKSLVQEGVRQYKARLNNVNRLI